MYAQGFGFTLRASNDFQLYKFNSNAPTHTFTPHYGEDGTGDVTVTDNIVSFRDYVMKQTGGAGVHVMMADGGFEVRDAPPPPQPLSHDDRFCSGDR